MFREYVEKLFHKVLKINTLRKKNRSYLGARLGLSFFLVLLNVSCKKNDDASPIMSNQSFLNVEDSQNFQLSTSNSQKKILIRSIIGRDTLIHEFIVEHPLQRIVPLSSAQIGYLERLEKTDAIVGIGDSRYVVNQTLQSLPEVGSGPSLSLEKVISLKPDMVMTFATGGSEHDYQRLKTLNIPLLLTSEWQEESPLAKAEWIKLYGILLDDGQNGMAQKADSIYKQSKISYNTIKDTIRANCPRVLAGMAYGGIWYAPGGQSYTAKLIKDAGGCYLWEKNNERELKLSLEEVMANADSADIWLNPGMFNTKEDLLAAEPRIATIKAYKEQKVYQNDGRLGSNGGNDFFESAVTRPAELLWNLKSIINPANMGENKPLLVDTTFKWYRNIFNL